MKIQNIALGALKPYWRNPRNNDKAVDAVADSIQRYGFKSPIIVDKDYVIIAGHTRYKAAKQMDLEKVPVIVADDLSPKKAKEYRIADNKTSELATWDMESLKFEFRELDDIDSLPGFSTSEIESLLADAVGFGGGDHSWAGMDDPGDDDLVVGGTARPAGGEGTQGTPGSNAGGLNVTQDQVEDTEKELSEKFEKAGQKNNDSLVRVTCPHCVEDFLMDKNELLR